MGEIERERPSDGSLMDAQSKPAATHFALRAMIRCSGKAPLNSSMPLLVEIEGRPICSTTKEAATVP